MQKTHLRPAAGQLAGEHDARGAGSRYAQIALEHGAVVELTPVPNQRLLYRPLLA